MRRGSRAVRHASRRVTVQLRRAGGRARRAILAATGRMQRRGVFVVISGLPADPEAFVRTIRAAAEENVPVEVLVLDFDPSGEQWPVAHPEPGGFPSHVVVRRFWRDAVPEAGGSAPRYSTVTLTPAPVPGPAEGQWRTGYLRRGAPVLAIDRVGAGTVVEHTNAAGLPLRREEIDAEGRLVRIVDLHPVTGQPVSHRYIGADGTCWLSVWIDPVSGRPGRTQRHRSPLREFPSYSAAQADWVSRCISITALPTVFVGDHSAERVVAKLKRSGVSRRTLADGGTAAGSNPLINGSTTVANERRDASPQP